MQGPQFHFHRTCVCGCTLSPQCLWKTWSSLKVYFEAKHSRAWASSSLEVSYHCILHDQVVVQCRKNTEYIFHGQCCYCTGGFIYFYFYFLLSASIVLNFMPNNKCWINFFLPVSILPLRSLLNCGAQQGCNLLNISLNSFKFCCSGRTYRCFNILGMASSH